MVAPEFKTPGLLMKGQLPLDDVGFRICRNSKNLPNRRIAGTAAAKNANERSALVRRAQTRHAEGDPDSHYPRFHYATLMQRHSTLGQENVNKR